MNDVNMDDLLHRIGQKDAIIMLLERRVTALMQENQALKAHPLLPEKTKKA